MKIKSYLIGALAGLMAASAASAENPRTGTAGAQQLRLPVGARATALSGAVLSSISGAEALYWNPAGASKGEGYEAMFANGQLFADMKLNYLAVTAPTGGFGTFGLSAKVLDVGEFEETTTDKPDGTGRMISPSYWVLGLTFSKQMTDRVNFGGTFNYINESVLNTSANGFALDFGFQYATPVQGLNFGLVLKSIGPDMRYSGADFEERIVPPSSDPNSVPKSMRLQSAAFEIPSTIIFGVAYQALKADMYSFNITTDGQFNNHSEDEFRFGGEFAYNDMFFLRGGYAASNQDDYLQAATFGAGIKLKLGGTDLNVDYSYVPTEFFDNQSWIGVKLGF